jgi:hypothetical protein
MIFRVGDFGWTQEGFLGCGGFIPSVRQTPEMVIGALK